MPIELFKKGVALVRPYLKSAGEAAADGTTPQGRERLRLGIETLEAAIAAAPGHWPAYLALGKAYEATGQPEEEYRCFRRAFELHPEHPDVAREFMRSCWAAGRGEEAVLAARRACRSRPGDAGLMANLGLALLVAGEVDEALAATQEALVLSPDDEITRSLLRGIRDVIDGMATRPSRC